MTEELTLAEERNGEVVLVGPAPGPAGSASVVADSGLVVSHDVADPRIVTRVVGDRPLLHERTVHELLGADATALLVSGGPGERAVVEPADPTGAAGVADLALLGALRHVPAGHREAWRWAAEVLHRLGVARQMGYDVDLDIVEDARLVAGELVAAAPDDERRTGGGLWAGVARVALDHLDALDPSFAVLTELVEALPPEVEPVPPPDRPPVAAPLVGTAMLVAGPTLDPRWTEPVVWTELPSVSLPHADGFDGPISVTIADERHLEVRFRPGAGVGGPQRLSVRYVDDDSGSLISVGSARRSPTGEYVGRLTVDRDIDRSGHRVEVVRSSTTPVLDAPSRRRRLGRQWALLALYAERTGARGASSYWDRSATEHRRAGDPGAASTAERYRDEAVAMADDPTLSGRRRLPFLGEAGLL